MPGTNYGIMQVELVRNRSREAMEILTLIDNLSQLRSLSHAPLRMIVTKNNRDVASLSL